MERSLVTVHRQMRLATQLTFSLTMLNSLLLAGVAATAIGAWSLEAVSLGAIAVAIARVLLKNAPILVLDEATSALDSEVEAAIQEQLYVLMAGKTVIAIAHRLSTIAMLDRLVVIDAGRIVETGRHDELLARNGLYAALWRRQSGGFLGLDTRSGVADPQPALDD